MKLRLFFIALPLFIISITSGYTASNSEMQKFPGISDSASAIPEYVPRFDRERPVVAVIGENTFTELTDYVVPFGILTESGVADVFALSTREGPIQMFPALRIQAQNTISEFDSQYPNGADYVIVPAVHDTDNPELLDWVSKQAAKGATILGICDGVWVVAKAGLLKNKKAVGHWYSFKKLGKEYPETEWVRDTRYLADGNVVTTTGVSASIPVSLALIEAIGGYEQAEMVAESMGIKAWGSAHESSNFRLRFGSIFTALKNKVAFWSHEDVGVPVSNGVDEISLALLADAYSRTYRSKALAVSASDKSITTSRGLVLLPDIVKQDIPKVDRMLKPVDTTAPAHVLNTTLREIDERYGRRTAEFVALQLEYEMPQK